MMKLVSSYFEEPLEIQETSISLLIIENPHMLVAFINELQQALNKEDTSFALLKGSRKFSVDKEVELITDIFSIDINNRKVLSKIYEDLTNRAHEDEFFLRTHELEGEIISFIDNLLQGYDYPLFCKDEVSLPSIMKDLEVSIDIESLTILEHLQNYVEIISTLFKKKLFVFINLKSFLSKEDLQHFYQFCIYEKIHILLIETIERFPRIYCENVRIIDSDLCEI